jgi:hypothetical protein
MLSGIVPVTAISAPEESAAANADPAAGAATADAGASMVIVINPGHHDAQPSSGRTDDSARILHNDSTYVFVPQACWQPVLNAII